MNSEVPVIASTEVPVENLPVDVELKAQKNKPKRAVRFVPSHQASAKALKTGGRVDTKRIFTIPISNLKSYNNPRHEPTNLYELGYVLIGNSSIKEPDIKNDKRVSLVHMALSDDLQVVQKFVDLMREFESVNRAKHPHAPQSICELADDINLYGQLLPICVRNNEVGDGGRRIAATLLLHADSRCKIAQKTQDRPKTIYPATIQATDIDCDKDELFVIACKINLSRKGFTDLQEGRVYHEMLKRTNPDTNSKFTKKEAAATLHVHYSTFRNREALWHPYNPKTNRGLTDNDRQKLARGEMLSTFASRKSLGEHHYSKTGQPKSKRNRGVPLNEMQKFFDDTAENNHVRRQAIADCMGIKLKQAVRESETRIQNSERVESNKRQRNKKVRAA
jgi:hypothetical protein